MGAYSEKKKTMQPGNGDQINSNGEIRNIPDQLDAVITALGGEIPEAGGRAVTLLSVDAADGDQTFTGFGGIGQSVAIKNLSGVKLVLTVGAINTPVQAGGGINFPYADFTTCNVTVPAGNTYDISIVGVPS